MTDLQYDRKLQTFSLENSQADRDAWRDYFSDSLKYQIDDLLDVGLWEFISQTLVSTTIFRVLSLSISILAIFVFLISVFLYVSGYELPPYDDTNQGAVQIIIFALGKWFGWSKALSGNSYAITIGLSVLMAFLSQASFSFTLLRQRREYERLIERGRVVTKHARQIYPGSGTIRFSYGKSGIRVVGNNINLEILWDAVDPFFMLDFLRAKQIKRWGRVHFEHYPVSIDEATHLLIYLDVAGGSQGNPNKINAAEYLVVPRRFFSRNGGSLDASDWLDFVENIAKYKQAFTAAKQPA